jgi:hypothetical protein
MNDEIEKITDIFEIIGDSYHQIRDDDSQRTENEDKAVYWLETSEVG